MLKASATYLARGARYAGWGRMVRLGGGILGARLLAAEYGLVVCGGAYPCIYWILAELPGYRLGGSEERTA